MESNNNIPIQVQDNNAPPLAAGGAVTDPNQNANYPYYPPNNAQNQGMQVIVHNNNYIDNNNGNVYNNMNNDIYSNQKDLNNYRSSDQVNVKPESMSSGYQFTFFVDYDLTSKFLMKVYGILLFEFLFIFALVLIFHIPSVKDYIYETPAFFWAFLAISLFMIVFILLLFECCPNVLRSVPCNYICLFIIAIGFGFLCAFIGSLFHFQAVLGAITCVIAICLGSFLIGLFNKGGNLQFWYFIISSLTFLAMHYGIMALIFRSYYLIFLYDTGFAVLYSLYIAFDTITIKKTFSLDDYILASIILTIDIIRLFLILLKYFGDRKNK